MTEYSTIYIGQVTEKGSMDPTHSGELEVRLLNCSETSEPIIARCAMPFGGKGSGFTGPVTPLSKVLVAKVIIGDSDVPEFDWFWIGVIPVISNVRKELDEVDPTSTSDTDTIMRYSNPEAEKAYYNSDTNDKVLIKSVVGHKLELSEKVFTLPSKVNHQEDFALLTTYSGKHIKLDAGVGPGMDRIIVSDENNNRIVIKTGDDGDTPGPNSMVVECIGNMHLTSKTGEMILTVEKDSTSKIQIINDGAGDVNVEARHGDIYVGAAEGDITLAAKGTVQVNAEQDINLDATENVTINAGPSAKINADSATVTAGSITLDGPTTATSTMTVTGHCTVGSLAVG